MTGNNFEIPPPAYLGWFFSSGHRKNMFSYRYIIEGVSFIKMRYALPYNNDELPNFVRNSFLIKLKSISHSTEKSIFIGTQVFR